MNYYDSLENVKKYLELSEGYDGLELIKVLKKYFEKGKTLLELCIVFGRVMEKKR